MNLVFFDDEDDDDFVSNSDVERQATALLNANTQKEEGQEAAHLVDETAFFSNFFKDVEVLVKETVRGYFQDKQMYCGGPIPKRLLEADNYITQVLNTDICAGVDRAYAAMEATGRYECDGKDGAVTEDIVTLVSLLHSIERVIPQPFVAGILLMHLELVEGVDM